MTDRKGARSLSTIPAQVLADLNDGTAETLTLSEGLAIDFAHLLGRLYPHADTSALRGEKLGITKRMALAAQIIRQHLDGADDLPRLMTHPSDTVRGWATYVIAAQPDLSLDQRLTMIRPLADDQHFGVREWAWIAIRPHILPRIGDAIALLQPWTADRSPFIRRFASEITRPRGVWCSHSPDLRKNPQLGLPLLEPLRADPEKYVQDSVANWLNDAGKDHPDWLRTLTDRWMTDSPCPATARIVKRGLRSL